MLRTVGGEAVQKAEDLMEVVALTVEEDQMEVAVLTVEEDLKEAADRRVEEVRMAVAGLYRCSDSRYNPRRDHVHIGH